MRTIIAIIGIVFSASAGLADGLGGEQVRVLRNLDAALATYQGRTESQINGIMGGKPAYIALDQAGYKLSVWSNRRAPYGELTLETDEGFLFRNGRVIGVSKVYAISAWPTGFCGEVIETIEAKHGKRKSYAFGPDDFAGQVEGLWELERQDIVFVRGREHHLVKGELKKLRAAIPDWA